MRSLILVRLGITMFPGVVRAQAAPQPNIGAYSGTEVCLRTAGCRREVCCVEPAGRPGHGGAVRGEYIQGYRSPHCSMEVLKCTSHRVLSVVRAECHESAAELERQNPQCRLARPMYMLVDLSNSMRWVLSRLAGKLANRVYRPGRTGNAALPSVTSSFFTAIAGWDTTKPASGVNVRVAGVGAA